MIDNAAAVDQGKTFRLTTTDGGEPIQSSIAKLTRQGWRPTPFQQFVLKINSRCNLACDYCYVYSMADQSWRSKPVTMAPEVIVRTAERITQTIESNRLTEVFVTLHGGEPLLAGRKLIEFTVTTIRSYSPSGVAVKFDIQTNGTLLDRDILAALAKHDVNVGISLDGNRNNNDHHRKFANGRSSYVKVKHGIELLRLPQFRHIFAGLLCVIDIEADPIATYNALLAFNPPIIDFLLPQGNWTHRPPGRGPDTASTPYADWLIQVFDHWWRPSAGPQTQIRFFEEIIQLCLGGHSRCETIGLSPVGVIVIDTDGSLEQVDTLKSAFQGAAATGLNVFSNNFDAALAHPSIISRQIGIEALSDGCKACPIHRICGGGYYPHRYDIASGFCNPSVYCPDLTKIIGHIRERTLQAVRRLSESSLWLHVIL
jgi:uncharacterized protein